MVRKKRIFGVCADNHSKKKKKAAEAAAEDVEMNAGR